MSTRKILVLVLIVLVLFLFLQTINVESFSATNVNNYKPIKVYVNYLTSNDTLASGVVFKSKSPESDSYEYIIEASLPVVIGGDHTNMNGSYIVYLGQSQDSLKEVGVLLRYPDHMYRLPIYTPENYMFARISLRKDSSETVVFDKQLL